MKRTCKLSLSLLLVAWLGCGEEQQRYYGDADTDADTDVDSDSDTDADTDVDSDSDTATLVEPGPLVHGLDIAAVVLYQTVEVPLMEDGVPVASRTVPVVQGKDAMLRVFVSRQPEWEQRKVVAQANFESASTGVQPRQAIRFVQVDSSEDDLDSTLNIDVPGAFLAGDLQYSVALHEFTDDATGPGNSDAARWPADGTVAIGEEDVGGPLELVIVPVRYNADGSGRLPDTSDNQIQSFVDLLYAMYPVSAVNITLTEPYDFSSTITAKGNGWQTLLNEIVTLRRAAKVETNVYYYGLFSPAASMFEYCAMGCVAGMSNLALSPNDAWARASIGLGFSGEYASDTMAHEVGHAHGRQHAPCGLGGQPSDPQYPHSGAELGTWGYDVVFDELLSPTRNKDIMSYCSPTWISDYTYTALFDRSKAVNALMSIRRPVGWPTVWRSLSVGLDGRLGPGPLLDLDLPPSGTPQAVYWLDANGATIGQAIGYFQPSSIAPAGLVLIPQPPDDAVFSRIDGSGKVRL